MKKSAKLKRKTIRLIVKNLIVLVILIAVSAVGVRSWFMSGHNYADASTVNVSCAVPDGLEVAIVAPGDSITRDTVWYDTSFTLDTVTFPFLSALSITEISGDGITFIKPPLTQFSTVAAPDTTKTWNANDITPKANSEYLSFDIYFRSKGSGHSVLLDRDSYFGTPTPTMEFGNKINGWSPNSVIGAARMSVVQNAGTASAARKLLWIPAPFLHFDPVMRSDDAILMKTLTDPTNTYGLAYIDSESTTHILNADGTYNHGYYDANKQRHILYNSTINSSPPSGAVNEPNLVANTFLDQNDEQDVDYKLQKDVSIAALDTTANYYSSPTASTTTAYYTNHVRVNLWIEGEDPESRAAQVTGKIKAVLNLKLA